jgi:hypothetical protein
MIVRHSKCSQDGKPLDSFAVRYNALSASGLQDE